MSSAVFGAASSRAASGEVAGSIWETSMDSFEVVLGFGGGTGGAGAGVEDGLHPVKPRAKTISRTIGVVLLMKIPRLVKMIWNVAADHGDTESRLDRKTKSYSIKQGKKFKGFVGIQEKRKDDLFRPGPSFIGMSFFNIPQLLIQARFFDLNFRFDDILEQINEPATG